MPTIPKISHCLIFDKEAEEAAAFYVSAFPNSKITRTIKYAENQPGPTGSVGTVIFELDGQEFVAANGGPDFEFGQGLSLYVACKDQAEIDHLWKELGKGGEHQDCGWVKDRYGVSWQITPAELGDMLRNGTDEQATRVQTAIFGMKKLDVEALRKAYKG